MNIPEFQSSLDLVTWIVWMTYKQYTINMKMNLPRVLNQLAPERTKLFTNWEKRLWFDQDIAYQKRVLGRHEKIWLRYRTEACWQAYLHARR